MELRPYQREAVDSVYEYMRTRIGNPCVVAPTGSGKSPMIATICRDVVTRWHGRVLVLAHVKELLEQTAATLRRIDPSLDVGVYSAGLGRRDTEKDVIVAGIQSVHKKACDLGEFKLIVIDEAHSIAQESDSTYRRFLADAKVINPKVRLLGMTATPYRLKSGLLCGPDNLLTDVCYEIGVRDLIADGFLSPLCSRAGQHKLDCSGLHIRGGEFIPAELEKLVETGDHVDAACREIVNLTADRHSVLIFAVSVAHANRIREKIAHYSCRECGLVTGETPKDQRDKMLRRFKGDRFATDLLGGETEPLKFMVNVNVLTTGFDAPNVDCVVLLRPTASAGLYVQMVGRGFRLHDTKTDCLVLDYGGNILRHGPVDAVTVKDRKSDGEGGESPAKECPICCTIVHAAVAVCPNCGHAFPAPEPTKHDASAAREGVLSGEVTETEYEVSDVYYSVHVKRGSDGSEPRTVRVEYRTDCHEYQREWVCPEHDGYARRKFEKWWADRSSDPAPDDAELVVRLSDEGRISKPTSIVVRHTAGEQFPRIVRYVLPTERPAPLDLSEIPF